MQAGIIPAAAKPFPMILGTASLLQHSLLLHQCTVRRGRQRFLQTAVTLSHPRRSLSSLWYHPASKTVAFLVVRKATVSLARRRTASILTCTALGHDA